MSDIELTPNYVCRDCREWFTVPVWHCPTCAHHWHHEWDDTCKNCHHERPHTARSAWQIDTAAYWLP